MKKILVVAFVSIKGGVGKTSIVIKLADCLASAGKRVLLADSDLNNSLSFHYLDEEVMMNTKTLNLAAALNNEGNNLNDFVVATKQPGVDLIASSPYLADLRTLSEKRLSRMIPTLNGKYDIMIIDCHPTYDNIVLNALHAADYAITPVLQDLFSFNAAAFLSEVLPRDVENLQNWFVLLNGYNKRFEDARTGRQNDFVKMYEKSSFPLTPKETWLPWSAQIHQVIDYKQKLARTEGISGAVCVPALYDGFVELAGCFFDERLKIKEAF